MRLRISVLTAATLLASVVVAAPAQAIVGGKDTAPGAYPAVAFVKISGSFACTGTLVAPKVVVTAGHCGSLTGSLIATPIGWPPSMIAVTLGAESPDGPGERATVSSVRIPPDYLATTGSDISLLILDKPAKTTPVRIAGRGGEGAWAPGVSETIVGYGLTKEDGDIPDHLQEANVPIIADPDCAKSYPGTDFTTQICAGFPQGGIDSCQGDSGGPLFGRRADGSLVLVGATSNGDGCARAGKPGIYARIADAPLREWIRGIAGDAVDADASAAPATPTPVAGPKPVVRPTTCSKPRRLTVTVKRIYRGKLRSVVVLVAGKRLTTLRSGKTSTRVVLPAGKPRTVTVKLVMRLKSGKQVTDTRRFKVCGG
ncbi:hypothetical protein DSM112329_05232 [Paraconexibacter sp. AEG42_29]|uniref:Peptidase S1 domain-containing protein n=1 Tax=Paraconexibacter sp. AEG42_29 TaxID=2997339 RepID=A0AAU7B3Y2_9ACTN